MRLSDDKLPVIRFWPLMIVFVVWFVVFFRMNTGDSVVGYRDSAYLYYPYFQWIDEQWKKGEIPLWNPYCDLGYPVVADGTSSVFYPGKLLFLLRFLDFPTRYGLYLSLHVLLASVTAYFVALRFGCGHVGAGIASFSYAFGGSVLFQTTNVVYLVSAAWLPMGLFFVNEMLKRRQLRYSLGAGGVAALMILGGDPQMAYLLAVIGFVSAVTHLLWYRKRYVTWRLWFARLLRGGNRFLIFCAVAFCFSAVQVLPTYFWSLQSVRTVIRMDVAQKSMEPKPGSHLHAVYEFSQPPWSLIELLWPNVSGKPFPVYQRWTDAFAGADRVWNPSLFVGFVTILLALGSVAFWNGTRRGRWLTWMAIVFALGSFGWYGSVWVVRELALGVGINVDATSNEVGSQVGGVYWLMTAILPGFDAFRYPAKLFTVASLAISLMAGLGVKNHFQSRLPIAVAALVMVMTLAGFFLTEQLGEFLDRQSWPARDGLFGPFDLKNCMVGIRGSLASTMIAASCFLGVRHFRQFGSQNGKALLFCLLVIEVLLANVWLVPQVDSKIFLAQTEIEKQIQSQDLSGRIRLVRGAVVPFTFKTEASSNRLAEVITWQRETLHPKHHLWLAEKYGVELLNSFSSIQHSDASVWREYVISSLYDWQMRNLINGYVIFDEETGLPILRVMSPSNSKIRLAKSNQVLSELDIHESVNESVESLYRLEAKQTGAFSIQVDASEPVTLLCNVLPDRGWQVSISESGGVVPPGVTRLAGKYHLAVDLNKGQQTVHFKYSPPEFWIGLAISVTTWSLIAILLVTRFRSARVFRL